jgi:hypothetical protein
MSRALRCDGLSGGDACVALGRRPTGAMRVNVLSSAVLGLSNDPGWGGEAPLWYYILKEAELPPYNAERLGPVGGRIVAQVLVGLLQRDPNSHLYLDPAWKPPHRSRRRPASSHSSTCCDTRALPSCSCWARRSVRKQVEDCVCGR